MQMSVQFSSYNKAFSCDVIVAMLEGKNNTFGLPWEIRSIFIQNCFIVSPTWPPWKHSIAMTSILFLVKTTVRRSVGVYCTQLFTQNSWICPAVCFSSLLCTLCMKHNVLKIQSSHWLKVENSPRRFAGRCVRDLDRTELATVPR